MNNTIIIWGASSLIAKSLLPLIEKNYQNYLLIDHPSKKEELQTMQRIIMEKGKNSSFDTINAEMPSEISEVSEKILIEFDRIDAMVYTIGTNLIIPALEVNTHDWERLFAINTEAFFFAAQAVFPKMLLNGGSIVSVASQHGVVANYNRSIYCASKAALIHLTKELALEWAKYNIRVNSVSPTFIEMDTNKEFLSLPKIKRDYLDRIPLHKYATPSNVANAIAFLLSDSSSMITGHNIMVDGGWSLS